jgi:HEAT repeat protein
MKSETLAIADELRSSDPELRRIAVQRIVSLTENDSVTLLLVALGDSDWRVRKEAATVAPSISARAALIIALVRALHEKVNVGLRNAAVEALVGIGIDAVAPAAKALESLDADERKLAVEILGGIADEHAIEALARAVNDLDLNVRVAVAEALGGAKGAGPESERLAALALTRALSESNSLMKLAVLEALVRLDADVPWATFAPFMNDPLLRRPAIAAAGRSGEAAALQALANASGDPSDGVAKDAVVALADRLFAETLPMPGLEAIRDTIRASHRAVQRIRAMAAAPDSRVRGAALVTLGLLRDPVDVEAMVRALEDGGLAPRAEFALRLYGSSVVEPALRASMSSPPQVRAATLSLIPVLAERPEPSALAVLRDALKDPRPEIVAAAVTSLGASGSAEDLRAIVPCAGNLDARVAGTARSSLKALALRNPEEAIEIARGIDAHGPKAAVGCVLIGAVAESAQSVELGRVAGHFRDVAFLRAALDHGDPAVRHAAVDALSSIHDAKAGEVASFALADEEEEVVLAAVRALGRMRHSAPLKTLIETTKHPGIVATTLLALREASPADAFEAARPLLARSDPVLASAAVEAIGQLDEPRRWEGLRLALEHPDAEVVRGALVELARGRGVEDPVRLGECLNHDLAMVRRLSAEILGNIGGAESSTFLRGRLEREADGEVREAIAQALSVRPPPREAG